MSEVASKFNAAGPMVGYLYQCREALLLAVEKHHASWARAQMAKAEDAMDDEAADRAASRSSSNLP